MKITFAGHESRGTWILRAKQIAPYLNAKLDPNLDNLNCDLVILIKLPTPKILQKIINSKIPIIWDIQDCWIQTTKVNMSLYDKEQILDYFKTYLDQINPIQVIASTSIMKKDIESLGYRSTIINHHHRKGINLNPIRQTIQTVGIEGSPIQFGTWPKRLNNLCSKLGLTFKENLDTSKDKLNLFDILINIREFDGYPAKYWKSNIKLANAHGSGTPVICSREQGYLDTACGYEQWADTEDEIVEAIETLRPYQVRKEINEKFLSNKISIDQIGKEYKDMIDSIK